LQESEGEKDEAEQKKMDEWLKLKPEEQELKMKD